MEGHPNIWIQIIGPIIAAAIGAVINLIGLLIVYFLKRREESPWTYYNLNSRARKVRSKAPMTEEVRRILEGEPVRDVILSKLEKELKEKKIDELVSTKVGKVEGAATPSVPLAPGAVYIRDFLDLKEAATPSVPPARLSLIRQILMYLGILIGVLFSTAVSQFERGGDFSIIINGGTVLISAIIALILTPIVYEKLSVFPASPFIVQFGLFVQNGVFWHVIINSIGKVVQ